MLVCTKNFACQQQSIYLGNRTSQSQPSAAVFLRQLADLVEERLRVENHVEASEESCHWLRVVWIMHVWVWDNRDSSRFRIADLGLKGHSRHVDLSPAETADLHTLAIFHAVVLTFQYQVPLDQCSYQCQCRRHCRKGAYTSAWCRLSAGREEHVAVPLLNRILGFAFGMISTSWRQESAEWERWIRKFHCKTCFSCWFWRSYHHLDSFCFRYYWIPFVDILSVDMNLSKEQLRSVRTLPLKIFSIILCLSL